MTRPLRSILSTTLLAALLAAPLASGPAAAQEEASDVARALNRIMVGGAMGGAMAATLIGPAGPSVQGSNSALIGGLVGAGVLGSFLPYPADTRFTATLGISFFRMNDLNDVYQLMKEEEGSVQAVEEPGLGAEWTFHIDIPWRESWWLGFQMSALNDAASVNASEIICDTPSNCGNEDRLVGESTAQSLVVAGTARWKPWTRPPLYLRGSAGLGYAGISTPLVTGLQIKEGLPETQGTVAPYIELGLEMGGVVEGKGPDVQLGGRFHRTSDVDYEPVGRITAGGGPLDFSGLFVRIGWTF